MEAGRARGWPVLPDARRTCLGWRSKGFTRWAVSGLALRTWPAGLQHVASSPPHALPRCCASSSAGCAEVTVFYLLLFPLPPGVLALEAPLAPCAAQSASAWHGLN